MHNRQAVDLRLLWHALCDMDLWPIYFLGLFWLIPSTPPQQYLTLLLKSDGFTTFETNLLTIPSYVIAILSILFWIPLSERLNERLLISTATQWWCLPLLITLEVLPAGNAGHLRWGRYVCAMMTVGSPYLHPIIVALTSRNAGTVRTRTVASAMYNMCVQASNIVAVNIYRDDDKPLYRRGNKVLISLSCFAILWACLIKVFYIWRNKQKERIWNAMTQAEKEHYLATTRDEGNRR